MLFSCVSQEEKETGFGEELTVSVHPAKVFRFSSKGNEEPQKDSEERTDVTKLFKSISFLKL